MTPSREWLKRHEVVEIVDEKLKPVIAAQTALGSEVAAIRATQTANHEENRRTLGNVLQLGENQLAHLRGRDEALKEFEQARQKKIEKWAKRIGVLLTPGTLYEIINFGHRLWLWHLSGHYFPSQGH